MITTNIDLTHGLANGAVGKLVHVETNDVGLVKTIWLQFPVLPRIEGWGGIETQKDNFALSLQNNRIILTTKPNTTIDAVFSRSLNDIECKTYISYFSYHKPLITKNAISDESYRWPNGVIPYVIDKSVGVMCTTRSSTALIAPGVKNCLNELPTFAVVVMVRNRGCSVMGSSPGVSKELS
ncbi:hypothetical protein TNCV_924921 [Trichonephila clavipes]|nr:hypothetical protein TNCV_924921 [Trichonephila clavipes]